MDIAKFYKEVKTEALRITWPNKKETLSAAALVVFLATLAGLFFLLVDSVIYKVIQFFLGL
jgi:preprotein translocase subunit SecE